MLNLRLAKSVMEQEEGMNHLWIQLFLRDFSTTEKAVISIQLPNGLYRGPNLNGYDENESDSIFLDLLKVKDVLLELYTQSEVDCSEALINVTLRYNDNQNNWKELSKDIPIHFVSEDEIDSMEIDEQVIERVKELGNHDGKVSKPDDELEIIRPRTYEIRSNEYAYLEKKYRVDY